MKKHRSTTVILMFLWLVGGNAVAAALASAIPAAAAARVFSEAHKLCAADHGKLWGRTLCGPMMFVEPASRTAVLNEPITSGVRDHKIWRVTLPKSVPFANTAVSYKGRRWSMILWPLLPKDKIERDIMLMHESYHRIQPALGLTSGSAENGHLDTRKKAAFGCARNSTRCARPWRARATRANARWPMRCACVSIAARCGRERQKKNVHWS